MFKNALEFLACMGLVHSGNPASLEEQLSQSRDLLAELRMAGERLRAANTDLAKAIEKLGVVRERQQCTLASMHRLEDSYADVNLGLVDIDFNLNYARKLLSGEGCYVPPQECIR